MKPNQAIGILAIIVGVFCSTSDLLAQNFVADSLLVNFGQDSTQRITGITVSKASDYRSMDADVVSVYEKKKLLFFPVDQVVKTKQALAREFTRKFFADSSTNESYQLGIHQFNVVPSKVFRKTNYTLYATIELNKASANQSKLLGTFYYEYPFKQSNKLPVKDAYENLFDAWMRQFTSDVLTVNSGLDLIVQEPVYHFRREMPAIKKNLYTSIEAFYGLNFWGIDGEVWFSEPEGNQVFNRTTGIIRYVNHGNFQSIAFGNNVRHWNYRLSEQWLFTHKIGFLLGLNNWKDMETTAHKMEEIFMLNLSFTQRITYNPLDKPGIVFGIGLIEDAHYIIYHQAKLKIGLSLNCAYKF